ncbi:glycosyltransferase family 2 protein [Leptospira sp. GIMC2001]|uniref:glycosyltransferase family 2 protein n=1 Tax=Leptospira sp. GIMC2001 TaxID=1513297 RepID=UPI00300DC855
MEQSVPSKLSVAIITYNEEKNISDCIESVLEVADEIIVLDSHSQDNTKSIAESYAKVKFSVHSFDGHVEQKNRAITLCSNEWILSLDADERIDDQLRTEILKWKSTPSPVNINGYKIARLTWHMGRFIRHSGWYPLHRYRLFRKGQSTWIGENPHDYLEVLGQGLKMKGDIIHYSFTDLSAQIDTINKFSSIVSFTRFKKGKKFSLLNTLIKPFIKFIEIYIVKRGFLDGFPGFTIAIASSFSTFLKFAKIYELDRKGLLRPSNLRESYGKEKE